MRTALQDPLELRCLGELLGSGYSEEVLIKWSLHPDIGPKLRRWGQGACRCGCQPLKAPRCCM